LFRAIIVLVPNNEYLEENPNTCVEYKHNEDIPSLASKTSLCIIDSLGFLTMGIM
jgi:hypothetical protein